MSTKARGDTAPAQVHVSIPDQGPPTIETHSQQTDITGTIAFTEIAGLDLPRAALGGAQAVVSGSISDDPAGVGTTYQIATIEARVVLHFGAYQEIAWRGQLGGAVGSHLWASPDPVRASRITVEARKLIDGAAGATIAPSSMMVAAHLVAFMRANA